MSASSSATCSVANCQGPVYNKKRALCRKHYGRFLKHGDPTVTGRPDLGKTLEQRFWEKVREGVPSESAPQLGNCWEWAAGLSCGYGQFVVMRGHRGYPMRAHRVAYELLIGPIPEGLDLDHLCRHPSCVNPFHLDPVPGKVNTARGNWPSAVNRRKTHCIRGHEFDNDNTYRPPRGNRQCRRCAQMRENGQIPGRGRKRRQPTQAGSSVN